VRFKKMSPSVVPISHFSIRSVRDDQKSELLFHHRAESRAGTLEKLEELGVVIAEIIPVPKQVFDLGWGKDLPLTDHRQHLLHRPTKKGEGKSEDRPRPRAHTRACGPET